jgi:outer membrane lipoprotein carrier protein LolA
MISGIKIFLLALLQMNAATPPASSPEANTSDTAKLIALLARPAPASTKYTEVRFVHVLRAPLVLHGELDYNGAGRLGKRVEQPYQETMKIADGAVDVQRDGRSPQHFSLDRAPELQALLVGFSALLGGDAATLEKFYAVTLAENSKNWTLTLLPRNADFAKHLHDIVIDGSGTEPNCFSLHQDHDDSSVMLLGELASAKLPDPMTLAALDTICHRVTP